VFYEELQLLEDAQTEEVCDIFAKARGRRGAQAFEPHCTRGSVSSSLFRKITLRTGAVEDGERLAPTHNVCPVADLAPLKSGMLQAVREEDFGRIFAILLQVQWHTHRPQANHKVFLEEHKRQ
jgi:hypothetical protein